jgi:hypothetical protein
MQVKGKGDLADRLLYEGATQRADDQMFWKGSDIGRYWIEPSTERFCRPDVRLRSNEVVHLSSKVYNTVPKILLRQTADTPIAALDERGVWFGRSIIAITKVTGQYDLEYLLGILNSAHIRQVYEKLVHERGRVFAQVKLSKLKQLPIRTIDFSDENERKSHDRMVDLVKQVTSLVQRHKAARSEHERLVTKRQIDLTESQIDDLVQSLYGLA